MGGPGRQSIRGISLPELLVSAMILSFIVAATAGLYQVGQTQQRTARGYSDAQTDLREALRRATRTIRHGYQVVGTSTAGGLSGMSSGPTQVIVQVPEPGGVSLSEILIYRGADGVLYGRRQADAAPGIPLITGVQSVTFNYFTTQDNGSGTLVAVPVDAAPQTASEVLITLTAVRQPAITTVKTYVALRNVIVGL